MTRRLDLYEFDPPRENEYALKIDPSVIIPNGKLKETVSECIKHWEDIDIFFGALQVDFNIIWNSAGNKDVVFFKCRSDIDLRFIVQQIRRMAMSTSEPTFWLFCNHLMYKKRPSNSETLEPIKEEVAQKASNQTDTKTLGDTVGESKHKDLAPEESKEKAQSGTLAQQMNELASGVAKQRAEKLWDIIKAMIRIEAENAKFDIVVTIGTNSKGYCVNDAIYHSAECRNCLEALVISDGFIFDSRIMETGYCVFIKWDE